MKNCLLIIIFLAFYSISIFSQNTDTINKFYLLNISMPFPNEDRSDYIYFKQRNFAAVYNNFLVYATEVFTVKESDGSFVSIGFNYTLFRNSDLTNKSFNKEFKKTNSISFTDFHNEKFPKVLVRPSDSIVKISSNFNKITNTYEEKFNTRYSIKDVDTSGFFIVYTKSINNIDVYNRLFNFNDNRFTKRVLAGVTEFSKSTMAINLKTKKFFKAEMKINEIDKKVFFKVINKTFIDKCIKDFDKSN